MATEFTEDIEEKTTKERPVIVPFPAPNPLRPPISLSLQNTLRTSSDAGKSPSPPLKKRGVWGFQRLDYRTGFAYQKIKFPSTEEIALSSS
jgi:hypothetical protein